ncbi:MAG TPA: hypothetical protein VEG62_06880, partial [Acidimicrobiales bacterium]|nr:hypothetical protein [Acidimicrobiales bacterium]
MDVIRGGSIPGSRKGVAGIVLLAATAAVLTTAGVGWPAAVGASSSVPASSLQSWSTTRSGADDQVTIPARGALWNRNTDTLTPGT